MTKTILVTCDICYTDYNSDKQEPDSCDVLQMCFIWFSNSFGLNIIDIVLHSIVKVAMWWSSAESGARL